MPVNPTWRGVLTDGPDFSYPDGRPAPALVNQVRRADRHRRLMVRRPGGRGLYGVVASPLRLPPHWASHASFGFAGWEIFYSL